MEDCLFCKIAAGEIPSKKLYEDDQVVAFYDINPQAKVHFLVIPKKHISSAAALTEEDGAQVIRIRDYGPGIPAEDLPHVKEKFYKGGSKARGSGIGLAVCDEIMRLHNGTFDIANAEGGGTVVTMCLPLGK